jgi:cell wall-associated NlpC family hydrolase
MIKKLLSVLWVVQITATVFSQEFEVFFDEETPQHQDKKVLLPFHNAPMDLMRSMVVDKALEFIGVNYKWGQSNENGFDCSGYIKYVYSQFGYSLPHSSLEQYSISKRLTERKAKPGDLVFFITRGNNISHVGIYLGENSFIHAPSRGKQVRIDSLEKEYFKKHLAGFGAVL